MDKIFKLVWAVLFAILGSTLIGYSSNWQIGLGIFFVLWCMAMYDDFKNR